ncbi:hypothetical protein T4D_790 [Trichinella pseudospiralis]|uniref:Uncharacterized protein n=1 Tax=Trichinella pseudospiralis TaxID=6337 RepID=A0A0V1G2W1_TRIPS|nr:hypothetical protein T4D_790 [Trichinella pseudospiralis]
MKLQAIRRLRTDGPSSVDGEIVHHVSACFALLSWQEEEEEEESINLKKALYTGDISHWTAVSNGSGDSFDTDPVDLSLLAFSVCRHCCQL